VSKERIELSLDPETIKFLRTAAIKKYGNLRSVSQLIQDLTKGLDSNAEPIDPRSVVKVLSPDIVKSERKAYAIKFIEEQEYPVCWTCGDIHHDTYLCGSCQCEFYTAIPDCRRCPSCGSTDVAWRRDGEREELLTILLHLHHAKFPGLPHPWPNVKNIRASRAESRAEGSIEERCRGCGATFSIDARDKRFVGYCPICGGKKIRPKGVSG